MGDVKRTPPLEESAASVLINGRPCFVRRNCPRDLSHRFRYRLFLSRNRHRRRRLKGYLYLNRRRFRLYRSQLTIRRHSSQSYRSVLPAPR